MPWVESTGSMPSSAASSNASSTRLIGPIGTLAARRTATQWPAGPINGIDEAFALAEELGMEPVEDVDGLPLIRPPLRVDGERPPIRRPPPRLDEHGGDLREWLSGP